MKSAPLLILTTMGVLLETVLPQSPSNYEILDSLNNYETYIEQTVEEIEENQVITYDDQYKLEHGEEYNTFTNYVDGYSLLVDKDLEVDMTYSEIGTSLYSEDLIVEIYKQSLRNVSHHTYVNYSNEFLNNRYDHSLDFEKTLILNGRSVQITAWTREKLSRVENDKNHYICMEIKEGDYGYTIFIKSATPISGDKDLYEYFANSFNTFEPTVDAVSFKSKVIPIEDKGLNEETVDFYNKYYSEDAELTWGIFEYTSNYFEFDIINGYEEYIGYEFPIMLIYTKFEKDEMAHSLEQRLETSYAEGKILELTLQTSWLDSGNVVYDVLNGEYDEFLTEYAEIVADFGHPVMFRLGNEMNGDWCPYSSYNTSKDTIMFREFYKYVYSFFENADADNVLWVWNPNEKSFPNFNWNHELMYYPGDEYVDIVGLTAYNTGTYYYEYGERWNEFDTLYDHLYYDYVEKYNQPLMITEFGSTSNGGDKLAWTKNMLNKINEYDRIKVAIWWDGQDWDSQGNVARDYYFSKPEGMLDIFKEYFNRDNKH